MALERLGRDTALDRDLFLLEAETPGDAGRLIQQVESRFVCLVAWDSRKAVAMDVSDLARRLLDAGAVYVCTWGPDCERVHDLVDEERDARSAGEEAVVMTTWHADESLADALWFTLMSAIPDEGHLESCRATVGISIGSAQWAAEIRRAFSEPVGFSAAHVSRSGGESGLRTPDRKDREPVRVCPACKGTGLDKTAHRRFTTGGHDDRSCPRCHGECYIDASDDADKRE